MSLPLITVPYHICRQYVKSHPELIFVYGQDQLRRGILGQVWCVGNEPNSFPVSTLIKHCAQAKFWQTSMLSIAKKQIDLDIKNIPRDGRPIIPLPRIGRGCSRLFEFAPQIYLYLMSELDKIKYANLKINYYQT